MGKVGDVEAKVDYWEFTVPYHERERSHDSRNEDDQERERLKDVLPGGWALRLNRQGDLRGWQGYTHSADLAVGSGLVGWSPERKDMKCHVSLNSQALDLLAGQDGRWQDLSGMAGFVHDDLGGNTTRLDLAFDDRQGLLDLDVVGQALASGDYVSRWRKKAREWVDHGTGGRTFYLGSPRSDTQVVIYDKVAERIGRGHADEVEGVDHWVRVELRLRRDWARSAVDKLKEGGARVWSFFAGVLRHWLDFKVRGTDTNKARWRTADWWSRFVGCVSKVTDWKLEPKTKTVDTTAQYVREQVATSLAILKEAWGVDRFLSFMEQCTRDGEERMGPKHQLRVDNYQEQLKAFAVRRAG